MFMVTRIHSTHTNTQQTQTCMTKKQKNPETIYLFPAINGIPLSACVRGRRGGGKREERLVAVCILSGKQWSWGAVRQSGEVISLRRHESLPTSPGPAVPCGELFPGRAHMTGAEQPWWQPSRTARLALHLFPPGSHWEHDTTQGAGCHH